MNNIVALIMAAMAGLGLGLFFFGGLYLTVTRGLNSERPALWFLVSLVLRMAVVLAGFYAVNDGDWQRLISCLTGFMVIGIVFPMWKKSPISSVKITISSRSRSSHNAP